MYVFVHIIFLWVAFITMKSVAQLVAGRSKVDTRVCEKSDKIKHSAM